VSRRFRSEWQPTKLGRRRGATGWDPFYQFEQIARDHSEPPKPPDPPKSELLLVELLTSKAAVVVMGGVLAFVAVTLVVLLVLRI
jgi:hypothetical protein